MIGHVLQSLTQVHSILQPRPVHTDDMVQRAVYPENKADDATQLLQLFMFPNDVKLDRLDSDDIQVNIFLIYFLPHVPVWLIILNFVIFA